MQDSEGQNLASPYHRHRCTHTKTPPQHNTIAESSRQRMAPGGERLGIILPPVPFPATRCQPLRIPEANGVFEYYFG